MAAPPAKRRKMDLREEFTVVVGTGDEEETITIARSLLTKSSTFFQKACNKQWQEGQQKIIRLPEQELAIFEIYYQWLLEGVIVAIDEDVPSRDAPNIEKQNHFALHNQRLLDFYFLADMLADVSAQNAAITDLTLYYTHMSPVLRPSNDTYVYENTLPGCALRRFLVSYTCSDPNPSNWAYPDEEYHGEYLLDTSRKFAAHYGGRRQINHPANEHPCTYHVHNAEVPAHLCPAFRPFDHRL